MKTFHLCFSDEAAALAAFAAVTGEEAASLADVPPWVWPNGMQCAIDPIGPVDAGFGEVDGTGEPIVGYRVNVLAPDAAVLPEVLASAAVIPVAPMRLFG